MRKIECTWGAADGSCSLYLWLYVTAFQLCQLTQDKWWVWDKLQNLNKCKTSGKIFSCQLNPFHATNFSEAVSHLLMCFKIGVPIYFTNFTRKHLCWREHLICNFIKKRLKYTCFPVKFPVKFLKFLRTPFFTFTEHLRWLLLSFL